MKLAVMQPYFLPFLGYFQLIAAVDKFVVFDDVCFIKRGWINRNRLLLNGAAHTFTVPLRGASQNRLICDIDMVDEAGWRTDLLSTIRLAYRRAPQYPEIIDLVEHVITYPAIRLADFVVHSLEKILQYVSIKTQIVTTSRIYQNSTLKAQDRVLDICRQEAARFYINPIGGAELYDRDCFLQQGVALQFLRPRQVSYPQNENAHVPFLSILDVLMFNKPETVRQLLGERDLC